MPIILPQNSMNNKFSVLYSCGKMADAKNIATANSKTAGNWNQTSQQPLLLNVD